LASGGGGGHVELLAGDRGRQLAPGALDQPRPRPVEPGGLADGPDGPRDRQGDVAGGAERLALGHLHEGVGAEQRGEDERDQHGADGAGRAGGGLVDGGEVVVEVHGQNWK
jgi:hypothetical protein